MFRCLLDRNTDVHRLSFTVIPEFYLSSLAEFPSIRRSGFWIDLVNYIFAAVHFHFCNVLAKLFHSMSDCNKLLTLPYHSHHVSRE